MMPVQNISEHYFDIFETGSIPFVVDNVLTQSFNGEPWHWTISLIVIMFLTYMKTEDFFVTSLPAIVILIVMVGLGKVSGGAILPLAFVFILAFTSFFIGIFKSK